MGWWKADVEGRSLLMEGDLTWGDQPADVMDEALEKIFKQFENYWHRKPTLEELQGGLLFSARPLLENGDDA